MPLYYDMCKPLSSGNMYTSNATAGTLSNHLWAKTAANQETVAIKGVFLASRFTTAGGAQMRVSTNSGTTASGGTTTQQPTARNLRWPSAQSTWAYDTAAITAGTTLLTRLSIGFAQTGGMGGWVPVEAPAALQMMPNATNPIDVEFQSMASSASVTFDMTVEFSEGI